MVQPSASFYRTWIYSYAVFKRCYFQWLRVTPNQGFKYISKSNI